MPNPQVVESKLEVTIQGDKPDTEEVQPIELDNCDGKGNATRTEHRSRSVESTVSAEIAAKLGASAEVISAEVQAAVGAAMQWGTERTTSIELVAPPGTRMAFQLVWIGDEQLGVVQNLRASSIPIAFRSFKPTDVRIKSQYDIGCPISNVQAYEVEPGKDQTSAPAIVAAPADTPVPVPPTLAPPTPIQAPEAPIREHFEVTAGSGIFAQGTFSDGLAPYSEQWL